MNLKTALIAATAGALAFFPMALPSHAEDALSAKQQEQVKKLIRETLIKNPGIIREALVELERQQVEDQEKQLQDNISTYSKEIFRKPGALVEGNPKGDVTVVEFFDYNCGYCRRAMDDVAKIIDTDKNVRVVFKELPIFGEKSEQAAAAAIAARKQGKYFEFHQQLMTKPGTADLDKALRVAKSLSLDLDKLRADMKAADVIKEIEDTKTLANTLGIQGTPFYLVGDKVIPGAPDDLYDQLKARVSDIRKNGCKASC